LALLCIKGKFQPKRIPLFITLKEFAESDNQLSMVDFLIQLFAMYGIAPNIKAKEGFLATIIKRVKNEAPLPVDLNAVEQLLAQGKLLLLLDGLDEVPAADSSRVLQEIQDFTTKFNRNQFVITCRIAAREYTFQKFTEVEVADFNGEQIKSFSQKWFTAKNDTVKANKFVEKLQEDKPYRELATNPLLLTLLCLVFEESAEFPKNRSELYKEGLDVLLKKWDVKRNIEREQVYKKLSLKRKEDLLSQVAYSTFEIEQYFFKQKNDTLKQWWKESGASWRKQLRAIMIEHRNIGHDWQFTDQEAELLEKYYGANQLLVECLNSDCYVSRDVRKYIEDTLLLPIKSIPKARLE
jgi:predicted NACHT family NTPase